jgi:hypothetical protein
MTKSNWTFQLQRETRRVKATFKERPSVPEVFSGSRNLRKAENATGSEISKVRKDKSLPPDDDEDISLSFRR